MRSQIEKDRSFWERISSGALKKWRTERDKIKAVWDDPEYVRDRG